SWSGQPAGAVLGDATQTNDIANYARLMLDLGSGPNDSAPRIRQQQMSAMRSNRKAIETHGGHLLLPNPSRGIIRAGAEIEHEARVVRYIIGLGGIAEHCAGRLAAPT